MKRTIPLLITAIVGFVLIASVFIPFTESWGEVASIWFDVLAAIAFVLGGGNLLKVHLKKISDQQAGWGYSAVTLIAFLITLTIGLSKLGVPPASEQEYYGETFAPLALSDFPDSQVFEVEGNIPPKPNGDPIAASVRQQLSEEDGTLRFRGWMRSNQAKDLVGHNETLEWRCLAETLNKAAQPPRSLNGKVNYYVEHQALSFKGVMSDEDRESLLAMASSDGNEAWAAAVEQLYAESRKNHTASYESEGQIPSFLRPHLREVQEVDPDSEDNIDIIRFVNVEGFDDDSVKLDQVLSIDPDEHKLTIQGPMTRAQRDTLSNSIEFFRPVRPLTARDRRFFLKAIEDKGDSLNEAQLRVFNNMVDGIWKVDNLIKTINAAGKPKDRTKNACELLDEKKEGVSPLEPKEKASGEAQELNEDQLAALKELSQQDDLYYWDPVMIIELLTDAGPLTGGQEASIKSFLNDAMKEAEFKQKLYLALIKVGKLSKDQRTFLLEDFQEMTQWRVDVGKLFLAAHTTKFRWSGNYSAQGSAFWWIYQYVLKPLTATMFAMLAFYVASAAFRAFRAKNTEAILLLGTAFIILLGQTFAGVKLTQWIPESLSGLRINEISVFIMQVFNTAGNRAIMIGIALGIASTSLKVLLGVDRSWLGSSED